MRNDPGSRNAGRQSRARRAFYSNLITFAVINAFFIAINLLTSPDNLWFIWPLLGWGMAVAFHGLTVFRNGG